MNATATSTSLSPRSLSSLSERVSAPAELRMPRHPEVALWRPASLDDLDGIAVLQRAVDEADHPDWFTTREWIAGNLRAAHIDAARDTLVALGADGTVLAYGVVAEAPGAGERVQVYLLGSVHPLWREHGIGRELMAWQHGRALQRLAASDARLPGWITAFREEASRGAISVALRLGLRVTRYFSTMRRGLDVAIPALPAPSGVRIVPFTAELSAGALEARNDAFRDHWGNQPKAAESWERWITGEVFRPDLSWLAVVDEAGDGGRPRTRVVGFSLASVNEDDGNARGLRSVYIDRIGTVRSHRGRGIAPACIAATLRAAQDAGLELAILDVDADSPTQAHTLYERLGFRAGERRLALVSVF
ncbi:GNAT family N-acetyltransferase [Microterricola pindariensis]|uniref:N-acetyltransferase domain-containing protein n=1 Tax=Microterricola pindariensis TaxID=478010 RepID=A0ABX5AYL9_9MICO|nr:GNAT family N-acetyltransferase [Microterricola pindariensis]PPL20010.1 hypothetical protein GY24_02585 [Microterricola pindariensis]